MKLRTQRPSDKPITSSGSRPSTLSVVTPGGQFEMARMADFVRGRLVAAASQGKCVRTAGWMDWISRDAPGTERVIEYEARMNLLLPTFDCTFVCVYDLSKLSGTMVVDVMATHPYVILKGKIRENSFYVPPEIYLRELLSDRKRALSDQRM